MRVLIAIFLGLVIGGCSTSEVAKADSSKKTTATTQPAVGEYVLAHPISYDNVTLIPVLTTKPPDPDEKDYVSLAEAKKNGWIEVFEKPGREQVSELMVRNSGPRPVLLLAGQLLIGGKQDRVVGKDTVVPAGETVAVSVYCVEHGRWSGSSQHFEFEDRQVPTAVKESALYRSQSDVWNDVRSYNESMRAAPGRSTIKAGLDSEESRRLVEEGLAKLAAGLRKNERLVGVIYAVDGKIRSMELFGSPSLAEASLDGILRGMLADAASRPRSGSTDVDPKKAHEFLTRVVNSPREIAANTGGDAARARQDPGLLGIDAGGIRGQERVEAPSESASKPEDRSLVHGTYSANED